MIDARRMEVFTAIYQNDLTPSLAPCALVLNENSFEDFILKNKILFFGNGSEKWKTICNHQNALFQNEINQPSAMAKYAHNFFANKRFSDLAYTEPLYIKDFQSVITK